MPNHCYYLAISEGNHLYLYSYIYSLAMHLRYSSATSNSKIWYPELSLLFWIGDIANSFLVALTFNILMCIVCMVSFYRTTHNMKGFIK